MCRNQKDTFRKSMIVTLKQTYPEYPDLSPNHPYHVIGIEADDYRIVNNSGRPYLYPHDLFTVIDPKEPADWLDERGEDGERYAYPPPLNQIGFFEDYFDGKNDAVSTFWRVINEILSKTEKTFNS